MKKVRTKKIHHVSGVRVGLYLSGDAVTRLNEVRRHVRIPERMRHLWHSRFISVIHEFYRRERDTDYLASCAKATDEPQLAQALISYARFPEHLPISHRPWVPSVNLNTGGLEVGFRADMEGVVNGEHIALKFVYNRQGTSPEALKAIAAVYGFIWSSPDSPLAVPPGRFRVEDVYTGIYYEGDPDSIITCIALERLCSELKAAIDAEFRALLSVFKRRR